MKLITTLLAAILSFSTVASETFTNPREETTRVYYKKMKVTLQLGWDDIYEQVFNLTGDEEHKAQVMNHWIKYKLEPIIADFTTECAEDINKDGGQQELIESLCRMIGGNISGKALQAHLEEMGYEISSRFD